MHTLRTSVILALLGTVSPLLVQAQSIESFTFTTNRVVPDGNASGLSDARNVNSAIGNISSVKVRLKLTGEFNGDLYGYLRHASGFTVLLNRPGKTAASEYGYSDSGFDVTFQTGAPGGDIHVYQNVTVPADGLPLTGSWEPDGRAVDPADVTDLSARSTSLTNFTGLNAAGEWTLYLADIESGGTNMLTEWGLDIAGAAYPTLAWPSPADIVYGTALGGTQLNATATYNATNVPGTFTYSPAAGTVLNAGLNQTLAVTFTPSDTTRFLPISTNISINVLNASLVVTASNTNRVYGSMNPALTGTVAGVQNGENITAAFITAATASSGVGNYTIAPVLSDPDGKLANYTVTTNLGTLAVTPASLTVVADNKNRLYGSANLPFTASYSGFVNGENSTVLSGSPALNTLADANSPAGAYLITAAAGSLDAANYSFTFVNGTLTVDKALILVQADDKNRIYGAPNPALTASYSGFVNGQNSSVLSGSPALDTTADVNSPVGAYTIDASLGSLSSPNYTFAFTNGTLTIGKALITVTANNASRIYGAANPAFAASYSGFVDGENQSVLSGSPAFSTIADTNSPVGQYPIQVALGTLSATNYAFAFTNGTLTVTAAALTVAADNATRVYGSANPAFTGTISGRQNSDNITATFSTAADINSPVGDYVITPVLSDPDNKLGNYTVTTNTGTLSITRVSITVTAVHQTKAYGATLPVLTANYTGFVLGQSVSDLTAPATITTTATPTSDVGVYPITASGAGSPNYAFTYVDGTLTITQALTAGAVVASANPVLPGSNVTFTASINAVAPGAGTPNGLVNFRIDGSIAGSAPLSGGAAGLTLNTLTHGTHTVVAEYAGSLNFAGTTNAMAQSLVVNTAPVAGNDTIDRYPTQGTKVRLSTLLANDSDADSDTLNISVSPTSANGGTITVSSGWVFYTPAAGFTNADSFTYTITDNFGGSATGTVTVAIKVDNAPSENLTIVSLGNGSFQIKGNGIPGRIYRLQFSNTLSPANWQDIPGASITADGTGRFEYTDSPTGGAGFYRSVYP